MTRYLVVPQWQGSPSSRAMQLIDGALAIAGDLPRSATTIMDVPAEAGESLDTGVRRLSSLRRVHDQVVAALEPYTEPVLLVGGDCGVAHAAIAHASRAGATLAVVWFDAHADFNMPETSPSGAFSGMVLRAVAGQGEASLRLADDAVPAGRIILAGARSFDEAEVDAIEELGVQTFAVDTLRDPAALAEAVRGTGADGVFVHVDVDVLDPAELTGNAHPEPFGMTVAELTSAIGAVRAVLPLVGASLAGYSPASPAAADDDLGALLRIVGALA